MLLTRLEKFLLKGALRADSKMMKWTMYLIYPMLACLIVCYAYIFFRSGIAQALGRVIQLVILTVVICDTRAYQSLIRKLYAASEHPHEGKGE